jgi:hypothetical protein
MILTFVDGKRQVITNDWTIVGAPTKSKTEIHYRCGPDEISFFSGATANCVKTFDCHPQDFLSILDGCTRNVLNVDSFFGS